VRVRVLAAAAFAGESSCDAQHTKGVEEASVNFGAFSSAFELDSLGISPEAGVRSRPVWRWADHSCRNLPTVRAYHACAVPGSGGSYAGQKTQCSTAAHSAPQSFGCG